MLPKTGRTRAEVGNSADNACLFLKCCKKKLVCLEDSVRIKAVNCLLFKTKLLWFKNENDGVFNKTTNAVVDKSSGGGRWIALCTAAGDDYCTVNQNLYRDMMTPTSRHKKSEAYSGPFERTAVVVRLKQAVLSAAFACTSYCRQEPARKCSEPRLATAVLVAAAKGGMCSKTEDFGWTHERKTKEYETPDRGTISLPQDNIYAALVGSVS